MFEFRFEDYVSDPDTPIENRKELPFNPTKTRSEYNLMYDVWRRCRDAKEGGVAIKAAGEKYLPKLKSDQSDKSYEDYKDRAYWYGATGRTVEAFLGMIFRKSPSISIDGSDLLEGDDQLMLLLEDSTSGGKSYQSLVRETTEEVMVVNRVGILEDFPVVQPGQYTSKLDEEKSGLHSFTFLYKAEDILNWKVEEIDGRTLPSMFVLSEVEETDEGSSIYVKEQRLIRILYLQRDTENGPPIYKQVVIEELRQSGASSKEAKYYVREVIVPIRNGFPLNKIPFYVLTDSGEDSEGIKVPPIYDLVEVNLGHYRNSADYEREMHWISIKTAVFPGWDEEKYGRLEVGGALASPPEEKPFILESSSSSPLDEELTKKEQRMSTLGAQLLAQKGRYVEAADTAEIHSRGESSTIASIARSVSEVFSKVFSFKAGWSGFGDGIDVAIQLNTDFDEDKIDPDLMRVLMEGMQAGRLSFDVFYNAMFRMEVYPEGWTKEREIEAIRESQELFDSLQDDKFDMLQSQILEMQGASNTQQGGNDEEDRSDDSGDAVDQ